MPIEYCFRSFFLIIWFKSVLSLSPRRLVPWQLTCAVWCLVGFEGSNAIPQKIATANDLTQIIQIWFVGRNGGLVVRCVRVLQLVWYSFSTIFIHSVWQNRNLIFVRHMLEANGLPAIKSILSVSMRELGMNH